MTKEESLKDIMHRRGERYTLNALEENSVVTYSEKSVKVIANELADQETQSLRDTVERLDNSLRAKCKSTDEEIKLREEQIERLNGILNDPNSILVSHELFRAAEGAVKKFESQSQLIESLGPVIKACEKFNVSAEDLANGYAQGLKLIVENSNLELLVESLAGALKINNGLLSTLQYKTDEQNTWSGLQRCIEDNNKIIEQYDNFKKKENGKTT